MIFSKSVVGEERVVAVWWRVLRLHSIVRPVLLCLLQLEGSCVTTVVLVFARATPPFGTKGWEILVSRGKNTGEEQMRQSHG